MIEVIVSGAAGRLGRRVLWAVGSDPALTLAAGLESPAHVGAPLASLAGAEVPGAVAPSLASVAARGRVLVETAPRAIALAHAREAAAHGMPILVATTGFTPAERGELEAHAALVPVLIAPNLSLGVTVLLELVEQASRALAEYDLEIVELHHNKKVDAPSGTAWALGRAVAAGRGQDVERDAILARAGEVGRRGQTEIGIQTVRGGGIVGEHTVYVIGEAERLELSHRAQSRDVFAVGAARAARFLGAPDRAPGLYAMRDVVGLGGAR